MLNLPMYTCAVQTALLGRMQRRADQAHPSAAAGERPGRGLPPPASPWSGQRLLGACPHRTAPDSTP